MANLTIAIDDDLLRRARVRAAEQGTSVNAVLRAELTRYVEEDQELDATDAFLRFARENSGRSEGRGWKREDLYAERLERYGTRGLP